MKLIDKDALVAEIEKRKKIVEKRLYINNSYSEEGNTAWERDKALYDAYNSLLSFLNTLEVKDVNLEKYYHEFLQKEWFGNSHVRTISEMMAFTAKHFFELGLKAQKGE